MAHVAAAMIISDFGESSKHCQPNTILRSVKAMTNNKETNKRNVCQFHQDKGLTVSQITAIYVSLRCQFVKNNDGPSQPILLNFQQILWEHTALGWRITFYKNYPQQVLALELFLSIYLLQLCKFEVSSEAPRG